MRCKGYCNEPDCRRGRSIVLDRRSDDRKFRFKYKNYKFVALIIIASYARNYLIKEELFANTWGGCKSSLRCSNKPPGDLNKKTSSLLARGASSIAITRPPLRNSIILIVKCFVYSSSPKKSLSNLPIGIVRTI